MKLNNETVSIVELKKGGRTLSLLDHLSLRGYNIRYYTLPDSFNLESLLVENTPRGKAIGRCRGRGRDKRGRWISFLLHIAFVWLLLLSPLGQKLRIVHPGS
ncbi:hypothetical protein IGI04_024642 [Brassica rapa subsp. trilocularis]|uniref:Uncharacterized protein n=1 Tax=Brassica rapa subsp. trilocularis TaxID=1813537 RepID=A0ABQ7MAS3_BRACM|nr:hypothetical protein IGI04_024642 [Brassica rapa subsp. trilocularis]